MGLDITAYSQLAYIGRHDLDDPDDGDQMCGGRFDSDWNRTHVPAYAYDSFPHALAGVPNQRTLTYPTATFLDGGCFLVTGLTEEHRFRAGSYSGYNAWRRDLARQFNPYGPGVGDHEDYGPPDPNEPFYELIWFADNEGVIATAAAANLLADFEQHAAEYRPDGAWSDYFREAYADWTQACRLAANGGLIHFH